MQQKNKKRTQAERYAWVHDKLQEMVPHVFSFLMDEDDFVELRIKKQADGSCLAIAKGYDSDGSPVVCFGGGYGYVGALMAIDATIQGGNWRADKPWNPSKK
jgi:hypothetical protein